MKVGICFENCYGIKKLDFEFDFAENKTYAIYAPNGAMKTSFAKTMKDFCEGKDSKDLIYKDRETIRKISNQTGEDITPEQIFVIEPYNESYAPSKMSTLLVNKSLKEKYQQIHQEIDKKKENLLIQLKEASKLKKLEVVEETLSESITHDKTEFLVALNRVKDEVREESNNKKLSHLYTTDYSLVFNEKVSGLLNDDDFIEKINHYIDTYDKLIESSTFFKKGVFNHNNADEIAKSLHTNGFFDASHTVTINISGAKKEINNRKELTKAILCEKKAILEDQLLIKSFDQIDKKLIRNKEVKNFRECIKENKSIISELKNQDRLKVRLWTSYLAQNIDAFNELMNLYERGRKEIERIVEEAKKEKTKWREVIYIFNKRFFVPFNVRMENQEDVILRSETPSIKFEFEEPGSGAIAVSRDELLKTLSNGEKRALYILNIIFEIEARKETDQKTLFVIDDIADSFDYKNKYAIIEYLKDISSEGTFYQIILSHNFDFYRTVSGRLELERKAKLNTTKVSGEVLLIEEKYQGDPLEQWKKEAHKNDIALIAMIPFARNIAKYAGNTDNYNKLTSLLHKKEGTDAITVHNLAMIFKDIFKDMPSSNINSRSQQVLDLIYQESRKISDKQDDNMDLERKVVLSIAIRLKTESYLISKMRLNTNDISRNQTSFLIDKYKRDYSSDDDRIRLLDRVSLMTPENIHLNSFMYEPILDMSSVHLKKLFNDVDSKLMGE